MPADTSPQSLTAEKNLWDVYKASRIIPESKSTLVISTTTLLLLLSLSALEVTSSQSGYARLIDRTQALIGFGFNFTISILGFLLAGFTIFATVTDKNLFVTMARYVHPKYPLNYLKYIFLVFMRVFIYYFLFALFAVLVHLVSLRNSLLTPLIIAIFPDLTASKQLLAVIIFTFSGTWLVYLVWLLQSFIFNVYTTLMLAVRWHYERTLQEEANRKHDPPQSDPTSGQIT